MRGSRGVTGEPDPLPLQNYKAIGFLRKTGPDQISIGCLGISVLRRTILTSHIKAVLHFLTRQERQWTINQKPVHGLGLSLKMFSVIT